MKQGIVLHEGGLRLCLAAALLEEAFFYQFLQGCSCLSCVFCCLASQHRLSLLPFTLPLHPLSALVPI